MKGREQSLPALALESPCLPRGVRFPRGKALKLGRAERGARGGGEGVNAQEPPLKELKASQDRDAGDLMVGHKCRCRHGKALQPPDTQTPCEWGACVGGCEPEKKSQTSCHSLVRAKSK